MSSSSHPPPWPPKLPLTLVTAVFVLGILLQHILALNWTPETDATVKPILFLALAGSLAWAAIAWHALRPPWPIIPLVAATGFFLAASQNAMNGSWSPRHLQRLSLRLPQHVVLRGIVWTDPTLRTREEKPRRSHDGAVRSRTYLHDFEIKLAAVRFHTAWEPACGKVETRVRATTAMPIEFGQEIEVEGVLDEPETATNFGLFDYAAYLRGRGIQHILRADGMDAVRVLGPARGYGWIFAARKQLAERLTLGIERDDLAIGIIRGMLLGYREDIPADVNDAFRRTGTLHVFAISGSHITLIALALLLGLRLLRLPQSWAWAIVLPALVFYVVATGLRASAIRSLVMAAVVILGWSLHRPSALFNNLAASALAILAWNPMQLFDAGFLLSFVVVAALILLVPSLERRMSGWFEPDPYLPRICVPPWRIKLMTPCRWLAALVAVSLAAWIGSLGLNVYYFNLISFSAFPANLIIVPLSSVSIALGVVSLILGAVWSQLAISLNVAHALVIHAMVGVSEWLADLPRTFFYVPQPPVAAVIAGYLALIGVLGLWMRGKLRPALGLAAVCTGVLFAAWFAAWRSEEVRIDVLDVGGGQCVLVTGPRFERVLLDAGSATQGQMLVEPFLRSRGVNALDLAVISHGDAAHYGGFGYLLDRVPIRRMVRPDVEFRSQVFRQMLTRISERGIPIERWRAPPRDDPLRSGPACRLRSGTLTPLWPTPEPTAPKGGRADDLGLVLELQSRFGACLFSADAGGGSEGHLAAAAARPVALLVQGLHANEASLTTPYLQALHPQVIVLNSGEYPPRAYPSPEVQARLEASGALVFRTDQCGGVVVRLTRKGLESRRFLRR